MRFLTVLAMVNAAVLCLVQSNIQKYPDRGKNTINYSISPTGRACKTQKILGKNLGKMTLIPDRGSGRQVLFFAVFAVCAERFLAPGNLP